MRMECGWRLEDDRQTKKRKREGRGRAKGKGNRCDPLAQPAPLRLTGSAAPRCRRASRRRLHARRTRTRSCERGDTNATQSGSDLDSSSCNRWTGAGGAETRSDDGQLTQLALSAAAALEFGSAPSTATPSGRRAHVQNSAQLHQLTDSSLSPAVSDCSAGHRPSTRCRSLRSP